MNQSFTNNTLYWQRENDNNSFYELNNEANSLTKMYSKAVKNLYIPFIPNNGYKLCVVARNQTGNYGEKYQFRIYEDNLSGGVIQKGFQFNSNDYVEPESKYAIIKLTSFGYTKKLTGYLVIDWSEITDGSYHTSLVENEYRINPTFTLGSISAEFDLIYGLILKHKSTIMADMGIVNHDYFYDNREEDCGLSADWRYDYIDPIDISGFQNLAIHFTYDSFACCPVWDENDNLLGNINATGEFNVFELYPTAKKIAFCWKKASPENYTVKYIKDTKDTISEHENRIRMLENQVIELTPVYYSAAWNLPNILNVPSDFDFWYYENSLISDYDVLFGKAPYAIDVATDCSTKNIRNGFGNIVCNGTYVRFSLVLNNTDGTKKTVSTHTITIYQKTKLTNTTKNVIFIGDSYVDNTYGTKGMIGWIDYFASQDGNTLVSKGIRTNEYGYHAEAYQGWTEYQFLRYIPTAYRAADAPNTRQPSNVVNSPFMFSQDDTVANAVFNFGKYINDFNIGTVDTIVFFLGMNGGNGSGINKMIFGGDNAVVSSMRDVLPNAKIIICMVPPYFNHDNYSIYVKNTGENSRIEQSRSYINLFEDKTNISICPVNGYNRIYGYRTIDSGLNMFKFANGELAGDATLPKGISNYDHHPSTSGVQQLAYNIYKMIFAN